MDFAGALILLAGALGCGAILGLILSVLLWREAPSYGHALRTGLKIGLSGFGSVFVCLMFLGFYENWAKDTATQAEAADRLLEGV